MVVPLFWIKWEQKIGNQAYSPEVLLCTSFTKLVCRSSSYKWTAIRIMAVLLMLHKYLKGWYIRSLLDVCFHKVMLLSLQSNIWNCTLPPTVWLRLSFSLSWKLALLGVFWSSYVYPACIVNFELCKESIMNLQLHCILLAV